MSLDDLIVTSVPDFLSTDPTQWTAAVDSQPTLHKSERLLEPRFRQSLWQSLLQHRESPRGHLEPTKSVDNFVKNGCTKPPQPASGGPCDRSMTN